MRSPASGRSWPAPPAWFPWSRTPNSGRTTPRAGCRRRSAAGPFPRHWSIVGTSVSRRDTGPSSGPERSAGSRRRPPGGRSGWSTGGSIPRKGRTGPSDASGSALGSTGPRCSFSVRRPPRPGAAPGAYGIPGPRGTLERGGSEAGRKGPGHPPVAGPPAGVRNETTGTARKEPPWPEGAPPANPSGAGREAWTPRGSVETPDRTVLEGTGGAGEGSEGHGPVHGKRELQRQVTAAGEPASRPWGAPWSSAGGRR